MATVPLRPFPRAHAPPKSTRHIAPWLACIALSCLGSGDGTSEPAPALPATARPEIVRHLRADLDAPRHASDGGGRVTLEDPGRIRAGGWARFELRFETGPLGIAVGGSVRLQVSPFWGFSSPQTSAVARPGYTEITTSAAGVDLVPDGCGAGCLRITVAGARLAPGETIDFHYGSGAAGARVDRYAEREERFFLWVDGDGDGVSKLLDELPSFEISAGEAAALVVTLPSSARVGEKIALRIAGVDEQSNAVATLQGKLMLELPDAVSGPQHVLLGPDHPGSFTITLEARQVGMHRMRASLDGTAQGMRHIRGTLSNPIQITLESPRRIRWADLHGHSNRSDGTGTPEDYYRYAREVAALDVAALTDHDHWGMRPLDTDEETWARIRRAARDHHEPGRFVTLLGYEWTSWIWGHRHVLFPGEVGSVLSSLDPATDQPDELWQELRQSGAITIPHHPGGGPVAIDWTRPPDPLLEPVVEISSVHGTSECAACPRTLANPTPGAFARDALARGYRLGFVGSGDSHDGHPGLAHRGATTGGLAAIITKDLTRSGVLTAIRARRVYATTGARILLGFRLDAHPMGSVVSAADLDDEARYVATVAGTGALAAVELIADGEIIARGNTDGWTASLVTTRRETGAVRYAYVRVIQEDGAMAWSSPIWVD